MRLAHGVASCSQGHRFFVVHGHALEGQAYVLRGEQWIRLAKNTFRVHINQAHLHGSQRVFERLTVSTVVACRTQPFFFRSPMDVFLGLPNVFTAKCKAKGFEPHGFVRDIARQHDQVSPTQAIAVFLFDGPKQATSFVKVGVVRPRVERRKALIARACAASAIGNPVSTCGMPRHSNHQTAVMTPVSRPPVLAVGHEGGQVFFQRGHIEFFDFLSVIETAPHRIRLGVLLMEDVQIERFGPPSLGRIGARVVGIGAVQHGALV